MVRRASHKCAHTRLRNVECNAYIQNSTRIIELMSAHLKRNATNCKYWPRIQTESRVYAWLHSSGLKYTLYYGRHGYRGSIRPRWNQGYWEFLSRNWKMPPSAEYQHSRKFPFLRYSKTSHKRTFRSANSSSFAGISRTAFCRTSNGNFLRSNQWSGVLTRTRGTRTRTRTKYPSSRTDVKDFRLCRHLLRNNHEII